VLLVPLSENALAQLPEVKERRGAVFCGLPNRGGIGDNLKRWMKAAGVAKHITFHCSRHTYATLLLTYGAGIYTVSSLLGHSSVQTTQVYARIVSEERRAAVACIPGI